MKRAALVALGAFAVAAAPAVAAAATFTGFVQGRDEASLTVYDLTSRRSSVFVAPPNFRGVSSTDGVVNKAALGRVPLRMQVRVTYHVHRNRNQLDAVQMLTRGACQTLLDEPVPHPSGFACPN